MRFRRLGLAAFLPPLLAACAATGPKFTEVEASFPQLRAGQGRIFFYRNPGGMGLALKPDIRLAGVVVGEVEPGGFFFVDRPAGRYRASARTEVENSVDIDLREGESAYVRLSITMGLFAGHPQLTLVNPVEAKGALPQLAYSGTVPLATGRTPAPAATSPGAPIGVAAPAAALPGGNAARPPAGNVSMEDLRGLLPAKP